MKTSCKIIEDLLPIYYCDTCNAESRILVEEHIKKCHSCEQLLDALSFTPIRPVYGTNEPKPTEAFQVISKKIKTRAFFLGAIITFSVCAVLAVCAYAFSLTRPAANAPCSGEDVTQLTSSIQRNSISPYTISDEDYRLASLLLTGTNPNIFSFHVSEDYNSAVISCDEYRNGELVSSFPHKYDLDGSQSTEGLIAVIHDNNQMKLYMRRALQSSASSFELNNKHAPRVESGFWENSRGMYGTAEVEDNKIIILYIYASDVKNHTLFTIDDLSMIKQYDYFCIVTCVFSK